MKTPQRLVRPVKMVRRVGRVGDAPAAPEENTAAEQRADMTALQKGFNARRQQEQERFYEAVDSEFWCCLCFQTREQKDAFLRALKLLHLGDKYLDGVKVAEVLGVAGALPPGPDWNRRQRKNTRFTELADPEG